MKPCPECNPNPSHMGDICIPCYDSMKTSPAYVQGGRQPTVGDEFTNRTGRATYRVIKFDDTGIWSERTTTGTVVKTTARMIRSVAARLEDGPLRVQTNGVDGISYTVAVEATVVYALGSLVLLDGRCWVGVK